ncbi:hypothetical protein PUNSTDRAFT_140769 [Punctularia strigosozonata HHB-11173 SS5]|uniref:uncharacterized protein n=1 Tax=Punctularia strigosozonata (strain HHB-11173) TaxID=741275 RepID=UPI0004417E85|nr:uncharacterized protein PUNSTDRAFT_140769 [Punctularia strigosozonata HHB-11173 SS5]EIN14488.1 hypothetical protein PUNSTDRAFT_140769 [Punctularia strigosozonata HHB-11173 SS5]
MSAAHIPRTFSMGPALDMLAGRSGASQAYSPRSVSPVAVPTQSVETPTSADEEELGSRFPAAPPPSPKSIDGSPSPFSVSAIAESPGRREKTGAAGCVSNTVGDAVSAGVTPALRGPRSHQRRVSISEPEMYRLPDRAYRGHARRVSVNIVGASAQVDFTTGD